MKYRARVEVSLKQGHSDPEGETTKKALLELNYPVPLRGKQFKKRQAKSG
jgi:phosphoribosylformylglycinamidine (FGAM) synthase PurS component